MQNKKEWPKELVFIDLNRSTFAFFNIELIKVGYDHYQVVFHYGKYGNRGTNKINRFNGKNAYSDAKKLAYRKFYEIKTEGYIRKEKMEEAILNAVKLEKEIDSENREKRKKNSYKNNEGKGLKCGLCEQPIHPSLYKKIESWGRNEGNWDFDPKGVFYKKVICLDCQIDKAIFQKRLDKNFKM